MQFYKGLGFRVQVEECATIDWSQEQLAGFKQVAGEVIAQRDPWSFRGGAASAREEPRLAIRARAMWVVGRRDEVCRLRGVWPALCDHFDDRRVLRDEVALAVWIAGLVEFEAAAEMARVSEAPTPD